MKLPVPPPDLAAIISAAVTRDSGDGGPLDLLMNGRGLGPAPGGKYRHWDTFRHIEPPTGLTPEEAWWSVKMARRSLYQNLPLLDTKGRPFKFALPLPLLEMLHHIDREASGNIEGTDQVVNPATRNTYLFKSIVEEAITSSQLEGASTTRKAAKEMIQEGRGPQTISERMIVNNYRAMLFVRQIMDQPLTPSHVLELQRIVTEGTLDDASAGGRFRLASEEIVLEDQTGNRLHTPPDADQLPARLETMCMFANGGGVADFLPPVVGSILLHFWLAYDHPFVDGNGRTARALFYWSMARQGYWLCEYVSISRILRNARAAYSRSYLYCESDENDTTYFLLSQSRVLLQAIRDLQKYLARKSVEIREAEKLVADARALRHHLNPRQLALLNHALKNPGARYTVESHQRSHSTSYQTARTDLLGLTRDRILIKAKVGRAFVFDVPADLRDRLKGSAEVRLPPRALLDS